MRFGEDGEVYKGGLLGAVRTWEGGIFTPHHGQGGRQSMKAPGVFTEGAVKKKKKWEQAGADSSLCSDSRSDQTTCWCPRRWEVVAIGLLPLQRKVCPHVSLLSFHYIQIRSATNFIKSKQSWSENGASRQSCGGRRGELGRRSLGVQGRLWLQQWKGQEAEDWGGAALQNSPSPEIPPLLWLSTSF